MNKEEAITKQEQVEQEENRLIQQRDHAHEIIDKLCDAVLGFDRQEWSSAYFFEDAVSDVEEKMWQLAKQDQGEPVAYTNGKEVILGKHWTADYPPEGWEPLGYTTPQRKPLTDEKIDDAIDAWFKTNADGSYPNWRERMRTAIKAAHGIKE